MRSSTVHVRQSSSAATVHLHKLSQRCQQEGKEEDAHSHNANGHYALYGRARSDVTCTVFPVSRQA